MPAILFDGIPPTVPTTLQAIQEMETSPTTEIQPSSETSPSITSNSESLPTPSNLV